MARAPLIVAAVLASAGCSPDESPCEEDARAWVDPSPQMIQIADTTFVAEIADTAEERDQQWAFRRCDLGALVVVPPSRNPSLALCNMLTAVDLLYVTAGPGGTVVSDIQAGAEPCSDCDACLIYGMGIEADAVIQVLPQSVVVRVGDPVLGLEFLGTGAGTTGGSDGSSGG